MTVFDDDDDGSYDPPDENSAGAKICTPLC